MSRLFGTIRTALDKIFQAPGRHVVWGKLYDFLLAILVAVCFVLAAVFSIAAGLAADSPVGEFLTSVPVIGHALSGFFASVLSGTFTFLVFFLLYWAAPNKTMSVRLCAITAVLAMVLSTAGTKLYMWTVSAPDWGVVYGSFIGIMATVFWLYWLCVIFIGSAEPRRWPTECASCLNGELDLQYVSVLNGVVLPLEAYLTGFPQFGLVRGSMKTSKGITCALWNPRARSEWMVPAASRAVLPLFMGHARTSSLPMVRKLIRSSRE